MSGKTLNALEIIEKHKSVIGIIIILVGFIVQYSKLESKVENNQDKFLENVISIKEDITELKNKVDTLNIKFIKSDYSRRQQLLEEILNTINENQKVNMLRTDKK